MKKWKYLGNKKNLLLNFGNSSIRLIPGAIYTEENKVFSLEENRDILFQIHKFEEIVDFEESKIQENIKVSVIIDSTQYTEIENIILLHLINSNQDVHFFVYGSLGNLYLPQNLTLLSFDALNQLNDTEGCLDFRGSKFQDILSSFHMGEFDNKNSSMELELTEIAMEQFFQKKTILIHFSAFYNFASHLYKPFCKKMKNLGFNISVVGYQQPEMQSFKFVRDLTNIKSRTLSEIVELSDIILTGESEVLYYALGSQFLNKQTIIYIGKPKYSFIDKRVLNVFDSFNDEVVQLIERKTKNDNINK